MARLPEDKREEIIDLFQSGLTNKTELARRAGVSKPTVYEVLAEGGLYEPDDTAVIDSDGEEYDEDEEYEEETVPTPPSVVAAFLGGLAVGAALVYFGRGYLPRSPFPRPPQDR